MLDDLIEAVSPQLSAPVTRNPADTVPISEDGISQSIFGYKGFTIFFAGDDDE
ncbi:hypothetical protein [Saccharopolyspora sp. NPDC002686]|uniref:hypothetical protein n=1 Tax=Saccharopolyspora sp. NPDC002686 TaxID=3154541 RepID=UPI00331ADE75